MRYEFERDGTVVASVLWEGPGQVQVETADRHEGARRPLPLLRGGLPGRRVRRRRRGRHEMLQSRRRDWTPWEFERACRNLAHRLQANVRRVQTGPVEDREEVAAR